MDSRSAAMKDPDKEPPWRRRDEGISVEAPLRNSLYWDGGSTTEARQEALMFRWKAKQDTPPSYFGDRLKSLWWQDEKQHKLAEAEAEQYRDPREPIQEVKTEEEHDHHD